ncbi:MAG: carbamoyltransferase C-terminal domain-containing protein [Minwuia sp.]|nr:carbamoyltransferase C-terminal domain-containing protein [Minwuia sp.]
MIIVGVNAFHGDSSACLVRDGVLVAAVEEERFRRIKHWAGFPSQSIRYCLEEAGVGLGDVDVLAINQDSKVSLPRKIGYVLSKRPDLKLVLDRIRNRHKRQGLPELIAQSFPGETFRGEIRNIEHHMAHLSSAFHVSPFEEATVVSVDGFGDFSSGAWGIGRGTDIDMQGKVYFPHSLGIFYQALTQYLGFRHYGDEYKVMGLAPYGQPSLMDEMREIVRLDSDGGYQLNLKYFRHHKEGVQYEWKDGIPEVGQLFSDALTDLLGPLRDTSLPLEQRHHDIARSVQAMYEEAFFNLLNTLQPKHGLKRLCLAGGCAMNSVANGKVRRQTAYEEVYIQSAAGDAGGAIGAAYAAWHASGAPRGFVMDHAYWGPAYGADEVATLLDSGKQEIADAGCTVTTFDDEAALCAHTADAIAAGNVIGWFQGRLEWGPRALGNRSILCDPRRGDMKAVLNAKIKKRESFRPFAPSIMAEHVPDWFEEDDNVPFMMQVFQIREERRARIPAVTHVDGSGRLQTVHKATNARYHALISAFEKQTGVPMLLNTSFNENEPVVCRPKEALDCFLRTDMDVLVLGDTVIQRVRDTA